MSALSNWNGLKLRVGSNWAGSWDSDV